MSSKNNIYLQVDLDKYKHLQDTHNKLYIELFKNTTHYKITIYDLLSGVFN